jgi:predicted GNAT family N-acyltransferase
MIRIEPADTPDLLNEARHIRKVVFIEEQGCPEELEWEFEEESAHYVALLDDMAVGTARWRRTGNGIKYERFAVLPEYRNKKVGEALLHKLLKDTKEAGQTIYLHAQLAAKNFYLRNGFKPVGEEFVEADIRHVKMEFNPGNLQQ